jgi:hypothetical protein
VRLALLRNRRRFLINLRIDPLIQGASCLRIHTVLLGIAISAALKIVFVTLSTAVSKSVLSIR